MLRRGLVVMTVGLIAAVVPAASAWAHVTVNPREAQQGGFTKLTFRVPNERDDAGTTAVEVNFPEESPLRSVSVKPVAGWTAEIERRTLDEPIVTDDGEVTEAVSKITWSGGTINPGEFQEFDVSVGPLPEGVDTLLFPAIQTYSSGEVVRWIEEPSDTGEEPEHPAPALTLLPASEEGGETATTVAAVDGDAAAGAADNGDDGGDDGTDPIAVIALILGAAGVLLGGASLVRNRSS